MDEWACANTLTFLLRCEFHSQRCTRAGPRIVGYQDSNAAGSKWVPDSADMFIWRLFDDRWHHRPIAAKPRRTASHRPKSWDDGDLEIKKASREIERHVDRPDALPALKAATPSWFAIAATWINWSGGIDWILSLQNEQRQRMRVPTKPAMHSNLKPAGYSDRKPATLGVNRMGRFDDVVGG